MSKALIPLATGFEDIEAVSIIDVLRRGGVEVVTAALGEEVAVRSAHGILMEADDLLSNVLENEYDAIILPGGGVGTENLMACAELHERLRRQKGDERLVCAICAAPTVLEAAGGGAIHPVPLARKWIARGLAVCRVASFLVPLPLLAVIAVLVFDRRQRKVRAKAIAAERRRIAAELHDSVSQYLSGTRILLDTVRSAESTLPGEQREALSTASEMLDVSRIEVRNAIDNLRNDDILTMRIDELLGLHARRVRAAKCVAVETDLERMPSDLAPKVKGDVLAVVQEAVANAIRHGKATKLRIESKRNGADGYVVRVLNDGLPFDASRAPGSSAGHFGIDSMHERGERSGFAVSFGEEDGWNFVELKGKARR